MRNPNNDPAGLTDTVPPAPDGADGGHVAERSCILSREHGTRDGLVRLALSPDGEVLPDIRAKAPGRGAWIGVDRATLETAIAKGRLRGALARAFKGATLTIPTDLPDRIEDGLRRHALDRLGLESKSGYVVIGGTAIEKSARSGRLHALYHASDAAADGAGKLAQAWRVGTDDEGSGRRGLALPVPRTILSLALGRENVVHVGITDARAARRSNEALSRWLHFIGPEPLTAACETISQGASTAQISGVSDAGELGRDPSKQEPE